MWSTWWKPAHSRTKRERKKPKIKRSPACEAAVRMRLRGGWGLFSLVCGHRRRGGFGGGWDVVAGGGNEARAKAEGEGEGEDGDGSERPGEAEGGERRQKRERLAVGTSSLPPRLFSPSPSFASVVVVALASHLLCRPRIRSSRPLLHTTPSLPYRVLFVLLLLRQSDQLNPRRRSAARAFHRCMTTSPFCSAL